MVCSSIFSKSGAQEELFSPSPVKQTIAQLALIFYSMQDCNIRRLVLYWGRPQLSYARLTLFTLGPGTRSTAEALADEMIPKVKAQKGFKDMSFLLDNETGEYGAFLLWESKEDAARTWTSGY
jgi:hypothetical protein